MRRPPFGLRRDPPLAQGSRLLSGGGTAAARVRAGRTLLGYHCTTRGGARRRPRVMRGGYPAQPRVLDRMRPCVAVAVRDLPWHTWHKWTTRLGLGSRDADAHLYTRAGADNPAQQRGCRTRSKHSCCRRNCPAHLPRGSNALTAAELWLPRWSARTASFGVGAARFLRGGAICERQWLLHSGDWVECAFQQQPAHRKRQLGVRGCQRQLSCAVAPGFQ